MTSRPAAFLSLALLCGHLAAQSVPALINYQGYLTTVSVPWGTREDWSIFVSPREMGLEEAGASEFDNALLMIQCSAAPRDASSWTINARYKMKWSPSNTTWYDGRANFILVPR